VQTFWDTDIGQVVTAANYAATAPGWMLYSAAYYLGYLPADLEATFESAIQDPTQIPGLVSNLVYGLLLPSGSLFGDLLFYASRPLTTLPGPIGQAAVDVVNSIADGVNNLLLQLPPPITPTPFQSTLLSAQVADVQASSLPDPSLAAGAVTLSSVDPVDTVEKKVEETNSTENTPPVTPPGAGDVDPDVKPPADPDVPQVKPDKPVTNTMTSGNKVSPGEKFDNKAKGETAKDETVKDEGSGNGTTATPPGTVDAAPGGTDPTGTPAGPNAGAAQSDPSEGAGAAA
jgi:hypothetical protein